MNPGKEPLLRTPVAGTRLQEKDRKNPFALKELQEKIGEITI
jgi:hypothetical protein